jgi:hypothetical protein
MASVAERDPQRELTNEEIALWWTPSEALDYAAMCVSSREIGAQAVWERCLGGMIESAATSSSYTPKNRGPEPRHSPEIIPQRFWKLLSDSGTDLWRAGDARFFFPDTGGVYRAFQIKFNPIDVRNTLPAPRQTSQKWIRKPSEPQEPEEPAKPKQASESDHEQKGPPVSREHLKAWFDLYRRVYTGQSDTEANAVTSARGMFPGKSVSRDSVRKLRGDQTRGRKPTDPAN